MATLKNSIKERKNRQDLNILIVEDQDFSRMLLLSLLNRLYIVHLAADAETALKIYCKHAPNIVLLDIELPGVNGHQLAATLRALDAEAYIVMVTGSSHVSDVVCAMENGAKGFIVKPYSKIKIMESIEKYVRTHRPKVSGA
jgi:CheY-like chemotaxis protein